MLPLEQFHHRRVEQVSEGQPCKDCDDPTRQRFERRIRFVLQRNRLPESVKGTSPILCIGERAFKE